MPNVDKDSERLNKLLEFDKYISSMFKVGPDKMSEEDLKKWDSLVKRHARDSIYKDIKKKYLNLQEFKKSLLKGGKLWYIIGKEREKIRKMRVVVENKEAHITSVFHNCSGIEESNLYMAMYKEAMKELEKKD